MKEALRKEIRDLIDSPAAREKLEYFAHPSIARLRAGQNFLDYTLYMLKFGSEDSLRHVRENVRTMLEPLTKKS